ncbi:MAG: FecCD family ABC transporter permease [Halanaerobium sp.]
MDYGISEKIKLRIMTASLITLFFLSLFIGNYSLTFEQLRVIFYNLIGFSTVEINETAAWSVLYYIRLPRILTVILVGSALSVSGAAYQNIFRNPLVSPDILGVSAGAGLGVALGLLYTNGSILYVYLSAFLLGSLAVFLTYSLSRLADGENNMLMVLSGIVIASLSNAFLSLLKYLADPMEELPGVVFYLLGGFTRIGWQEFYLLAPIIIIGTFILLILRWHLNLFTLGEEEALSLGVNIERVKLAVIIFSTMMVSASTAAAGQVSWIGLVVPHIARFLVGTNYKYLLPSSAVMGGFMLLLMDNLARSISGAELPISIITALIGAPFFAYLIISRRESGWS